MTFVQAVLALGGLGVFMVLSVVLTVRLTRRLAPGPLPGFAPAPRRPTPAPLAGPARARPTAPGRALPAEASAPAGVPLRLRPSFLAPPEAAFLHALEAALPGGHRVFARVRLDDLFQGAAGPPAEARGALARLRGGHVDFLVVSLPGLRPLLAIELDAGDHAGRRGRDPVLAAALARAGLPLARARAGEVWTPAQVAALLDGPPPPTRPAAGRRAGAVRVGRG